MSYFVCDGCNKKHEIFSRGGAQRAAERFKIPYLGEIPITPTLREGGDNGVPSLVQDPHSEVSKSFLEIAAKLAGQLSIASEQAKKTQGLKNRFELSAGFLAQGAHLMVTKEQVYEALHECYDPEIPVNIVDLGLVYDVEINDDKVAVKMTLTAPGCGMGTMIAADAKEKIMALDGVGDATVDLVWDPPWNPSMIAEEAKQRLGIV